jgi:hypothetical protein
MNTFSTDNILANGITATTISATTYQGIETEIYPSGTIQGFWYNPQYNGQANATQANKLRGYHITIRKDISINQVLMKATATAVGGKIIFGIYSLNSLGYPNELIFQTSEFLTSINSSQTESISQTLLAGNYFLACNSNLSTATVVGPIRNQMYNPAIGTLTPSQAFIPQGLTVNLTYNPTLPSTFPAGATSTGTAGGNGLWFRIA